MANGSYFQFDGDNMIMYIYAHNCHKKIGQAEYTHPQILHEIELGELTLSYTYFWQNVPDKNFISPILSDTSALWQ